MASLIPNGPVRPLAGHSRPGPFGITPLILIFARDLLGGWRAGAAALGRRQRDRAAWSSVKSSRLAPLGSGEQGDCDEQAEHGHTPRLALVLLRPIAGSSAVNA